VAWIRNRLASPGVGASPSKAGRKAAAFELKSRGNADATIEE
jgi:hypothetical protein